MVGRGPAPSVGDDPGGAERQRRGGRRDERREELAAALRAAIDPLREALGGGAAAAGADAEVLDPASKDDRAKQARARVRRAVRADVARVAEVVGEPESSPAVAWLPLPAARNGDEETAAALAPAVAPLVAEVSRLRAEIGELRERGDGEEGHPRRRELVQLLAGILVCFVLVAIALVVIVKA